MITAIAGISPDMEELDYIAAIMWGTHEHGYDDYLLGGMEPEHVELEEPTFDPTPTLHEIVHSSIVGDGGDVSEWSQPMILDAHRGLVPWQGVV